jgi:L-threonylcarbamoyladenylate synthase
MAVTSANISGQPSPTTADQVYSQLNGRIPMIIDGGETPGGIPSTLVDCTGDEIQVLREGPISKAELLKIV